jgi:hypothetical protein
MDKATEANSISSTELFIILGCGVLFMKWVIGLALIAAPWVQFEWRHRARRIQTSRPVKKQEYFDEVREMLAA